MILYFIFGFQILITNLEKIAFKVGLELTGAIPNIILRSNVFSALLSFESRKQAYAVQDKLIEQAQKVQY